MIGFIVSTIGPFVCQLFLTQVLVLRIYHKSILSRKSILLSQLYQSKAFFTETSTVGQVQEISWK